MIKLIKGYYEVHVNFQGSETINSKPATSDGKDQAENTANLVGFRNLARHTMAFIQVPSTEKETNYFRQELRR
jgi:hypothetical protein